MKKWYSRVLVFMIVISSSVYSNSNALKLYNKIGLKNKIGFEVFEYAFNGFRSIKNKTNDSTRNGNRI